MSQQNIKVAVRVRPFSEKEKLAETPCVVSMNKNTTELFNLNKSNESHKYTFDYSFWSHDGYEVEQNGYMKPTSKKFTSQEKVFETVGLEMLEAAWEGYNCTVFAYGQTASGKSYTVMGYGPNQGLVPQLCQTLFRQISERSDNADIAYEVTFSMIEIYNEQVRDLLVNKNDRKALDVRERADRSFHVRNLTTRPVANYASIEVNLTQGNKNRSIGSTNMNETSSRAHTMITINFHQKNAATKLTKTAIINLVDLAGSERQNKTGATGDRFKESTHINKSLSTLGNVIKALCDIQKGNKSNIHVPYRDSNLTKLLKNSLGGNCKTTMVATISPSPYNYDETLSTLKYANRAKQLQTHARVNESETDKIIRELMEEQKKLLRDLQRYQTGSNNEDMVELKLEIQKHNEEIESLNKSWETRLQEAQLETEVRLSEYESERMKRETTPYLWNLNEDPSLCNKVVHFLEGSNRVGNAEGTDDIVLRGPTIHSKHAIIKQDNGKISMTARNGQVSVNGHQLNKDEKIRLHHDNRICFGSHCLFVVADPKKGKESTVSYESARAELAQKLLADIKAEDEYLRQQILEVLPLVNEANTISERFNRNVTFELLLVSGEARALSDGRTEAYVKYVCGSSQRRLSYMWQRAKFLARHGRMIELYNEYEARGVEAISAIPQLTDPFYESDELDCLIGIAAIPLIALTLMQPYEETLSLLNYEAERAGGLEVELLPCNKDGEELEYMIDDPSELRRHDLNFKVTIFKALGLPKTFFQTWCQYRFYKDKMTVGGSAGGVNPIYDLSRVISVEKGRADSSFTRYLEDEYLFIEVWGHQSMNDIQPAYVGSMDSKEIANLRTELESLKSLLRDVNEIAEISLSASCQDNECEASSKLSDIADMTGEAA